MEEADFQATRELFGGDAAGPSGDKGGNPLDLLLPKSAKDFEEYADAVADRYVTPHRESKHLKVRWQGLALLGQVLAAVADIGFDRGD